MSRPTSVDQYIRSAPRETQALLRRIRAAIREAVPEADESLSYGMPFYSCPGDVGIERRLCYFGLQPAGIGLYFRPKDLEPHAEPITQYRSTKSALRFPIDRPIPIALIQKLVRDANRRHLAGKQAVGQPRR
jgi:uncharacterized protein YdhG (YjbR/CyaY superfamily)